MDRSYLETKNDIVQQFVTLKHLNFGKPFLVYINSRCLLTVYLGVEIQNDYLLDEKGFRVPYIQHTIGTFNCLGEAHVDLNGEITIDKELNEHYSITISDITKISPVSRSELP